MRLLTAPLDGFEALEGWQCSRSMWMWICYFFRFLLSMTRCLHIFAAAQQCALPARVQQVQHLYFICLPLRFPQPDGATRSMLCPWCARVGRGVVTSSDYNESGVVRCGPELLVLTDISIDCSFIVVSDLRSCTKQCIYQYRKRGDQHCISVGDVHSTIW